MIAFRGAPAGRSTPLICPRMPPIALPGQPTPAVCPRMPAIALPGQPTPAVCPRMPAIALLGQPTPAVCPRMPPIALGRRHVRPSFVLRSNHLVQRRFQAKHLPAVLQRQAKREHLVWISAPPKRDAWGAAASQSHGFVDKRGLAAAAATQREVLPESELA